MAHASIITRLVQQIGGAFGVALLAVILEATTRGANNVADLAHGFDVAFWWAVGFTVVAILVCPVLPARPADGAAPGDGPAKESEADAADIPLSAAAPRLLDSQIANPACSRASARSVSLTQSASIRWPPWTKVA